MDIDAQKEKKNNVTVAEEDRSLQRCLTGQICSRPHGSPARNTSLIIPRFSKVTNAWCSREHAATTQQHLPQRRPYLRLPATHINYYNKSSIKSGNNLLDCVSFPFTDSNLLISLRHSFVPSPRTFSESAYNSSSSPDGSQRLNEPRGHTLASFPAPQH